MSLPTDDELDPFASLCGSTVGPWLLIDRFDSGSFGVVFRAQRAGHPESGPFAVKMAKQPWDERFEREARLLQRVKHPAIPRFEDFGVWTSRTGQRYPYIAMEWIEGFSLYDWFREAPRTHREVFQVLAQVSRGLEAVHATGAVHRDVKGDNIRVTTAGRAVLLDFGSGWFPGARPLTDTCAPPGTTPYRPPEQMRFIWRFRKDDEARWHARASDDLYSLGATAFRLVTGAYLPPVSETGNNEARKKLRPSQLATVTPQFESFILRLLSEDLEKRGSATKAAVELESSVQQPSPALEQRILAKLPAAVEQRSSSEDRSPPPTGTQSSAPPEAPACGFVPSWLSWAGAATMGAAAALGLVALRQGLPDTAAPPPPIADESPPPPIDTPDAGVGDTALASAQPFPRTPSPILSLGAPMPKQPFPGQRKPPCDPILERAINGGCWLGPIGTRKPPCGNLGYDYDGGCYAPNFNGPRQPTSDPP